MLRDGEYVAWFRTSRGSETGRVLLHDGKVLGSDSVISYSGSCRLEDGKNLFIMKLSTRRRLLGPESVVGADEVDLTLAGRSKGAFAACSGSVDTSPDIKVEVMLFPVRADEPTSCDSPSAFGS
jgi:hypothetical protein